MCQKDYLTKNRNFKHINYNEKTQIERWYNIEHRKLNEIAELLDKSVRTFKRRKVKNLTTYLEEIWVYSADIAQQKYEYYIYSKGPELKLERDIKLAEYIEERKKSPEILLEEIKNKELKFKAKVCAKTIKNCIYKGILNLTEKDMIYKKEFKEKNKEKYHSITVPVEKSIAIRPPKANERREHGHWEVDLVVGKKDQGTALLTFTEKKTREEIIIKIANNKAKSVAKAIDLLKKDIEKNSKKNSKQ